MSEHRVGEPRRIAVVGAGGAGLVAAWRLATIAEVTVYEAEAVVGGHARTVDVPSSSGIVPVDMGVELFNERNWPNFCALLDAIGIDTFVAPLTFAASFSDSEYWQNVPGCRTPLWKRIAPECDRFHMDMHRVVAGRAAREPGAQSIGEYVRSEGYSPEFLHKALLPMLSCFSGSRAPLQEFSLLYAAACFAEGMLSFVHPPYYRKVVGGIVGYLQKLASTVQRVRASCRVSRIERYADRVIVADPTGQEDEFDHVVICTHADVALSLLYDPTALERELLGSFQYHEARSILHTDASVLAPGIHGRTDCEFRHVGPNRGEALDGAVTRNVTQIHGLDPERDPIFVTLNPQMDIAASRVIAESVWKHPKLRPKDIGVKRRVREIQGVRRTWFGGLDVSLTGHESAVVCGLLLAETLGAPYPFSADRFAVAQRAMISNVMGIPQS